MEEKYDRERFEGQIARYKVLARQSPDEETARRINEVVSELEQQLHAKQE